MFRKIVLALMLSSSFSLAMSASMVQRVAKEELGCIKGLGVKRVESIVKYRKKSKISSLEDLLDIKGIGQKILKNIKNDTHKKVCTNFEQKTKKKRVSKKKNIKAE